jgi:hypothetical protein
MASPFAKQISNRNFLSPIGFKFSLAKYPKVDFFSSSANIPEISLATAIQPSYLKNIDIPGEKLTYGDLRLSFIVDENLENYSSVHNWLTGIGFPESTSQYKELTTNEDDIRDPNLVFSDGSLHILNSNFRDIAIIKFKDLYPVSLSSLTFDAKEQDYSYFTADATFKYTVYNILDKNGKPL